MKTLNTIQKLSKVGKILCRIIFIFCLVGAIGCAVGIIGLAAVPGTLQIGGVTIHGLIEENAEVSVGTCYAAMATGLILCAGEAVLCKLAGKYFEGELAAGTPFTFEGAKEMIRLGVYTICIPIGTGMVASIVYAVLKLALADVAPLDWSAFGSGSLGLGIMFIISGLLCRHGAEVKEENAQNKAE